MKKFVKRCLIFVVLPLSLILTFLFSYALVSYVKYTKIPLNAESITSPSLSVALYAKDNRPIEEENLLNGDFAPLEELNDYTKNAFISIEDKEFFRHNGLNKKRIVKAFLKNLASFKLKEGASTISQQLVKNTHLSNEKTFQRKLKEVALTKKLEKQFSKEEIFESYVNIIFFGNNCYGIESASKYYFDKNAKDLTLAESALLAGLIKAPSRYSPTKNPENAIARRNLVLNEMAKDGYITEEEKFQAQNEDLNLKISARHLNKLNSYSQACLDEASKILGLSTKQIAIGEYKIHTFLDLEKQENLLAALENNKFESADSQAIVIDSKNHGVVAYCGESDFRLLDISRQPASTLKPLLVYAPALNEGVISPMTQILDEEIKLGDYIPQNVNKKFSGYVSVTDAVKNSINIPAIKVLSYIGIDTGKQYAQNLGIKFDDKDDSYALALGGMTYGVTLKDLTNAYSVFANDGNFSPCGFVEYITDKNGQLVYVFKPHSEMVFRPDSTALMVEILKESTKSGTARKLSDISDVEIASKTGTAGSKNGNTDALNVSVLPEEAIGVWMGNLSNEPLSIAGGNQPTQIVKDYVKTQKYQKTKFNMPNSVVEAKIDLIELEENHRLVLANPYTPERYVKTALFSRFFLPQEISENFSEKPSIDATCKIENGQILVSINAQKHLQYMIFKDENAYEKISEKEGKISIKIPFSESECRVKILANYATSENNSLESEKVFDLKNLEYKENKRQKSWFL